MKYRCLTDDELQELENEFKHFLITNHVYTEEWEDLNRQKDKRVLELIEMFSDVVLEKALKNVRFLEHITKNDIKAFKCDNNEMILIGINLPSNSKFNFLNDSPETIKSELSIFMTSKPYFKERELEVFELMESGCSIIDEERFKKLELVYTYSKKEINN